MSTIWVAYNGEIFISPARRLSIHPLSEIKESIFHQFQTADGHLHFWPDL